MTPKVFWQLQEATLLHALTPATLMCGLRPVLGALRNPGSRRAHEHCCPAEAYRLLKAEEIEGTCHLQCERGQRGGRPTCLLI